MSRVILIGSFAAVLAAGCTQGANAIESANQTAWAQAAWPVPMLASTRGAAFSVSVSSISTTPCGTSRTSLNADRGDR